MMQAGLMKPPHRRIFEQSSPDTPKLKLKWKESERILWKWQDLADIIGRSKKEMADQWWKIGQ